MSQRETHLEPLALEPWRVLVVAAHPGDIESGASAAVAKWTNDGAEVIYLIGTRGELSMPGIEPAIAALVRSGEQSAAAAAVGVQLVDFLDLDDGTVEASIPLRRAIVRDIRRFRPDVVLVMNHHDIELDGTRNDPDHRAIGTAALDAVGAAANQWVFRDVGDAHLVTTVLVAGSPMASHAIDVTGFEEHAGSAFSAHAEHLESVAAHPMAEPSWLASSLKATGGRAGGISAAVAVERVDLGHGRPCHSFITKEFADPDGRPRAKKLSNAPKSAKTPARARNAAPTAAKAGKKPRRAKSQAPAPTAPTEAAMKLKVRLEKDGRSIGIEIPDHVMERLGMGRRPTVAVEINGTTFDTTIGTSKGRRFIAVNAERRKAAGIDVDDVFFMALSPRDETS